MFPAVAHARLRYYINKRRPQHLRVGSFGTVYSGGGLGDIIVRSPATNLDSSTDVSRKF